MKLKISTVNENMNIFVSVVSSNPFSVLCGEYGILGEDVAKLMNSAADILKPI